MSRAPSRGGLRRVAWIGAGVVAAAVWWASSTPGSDLPGSFPHADKLVHAAVYAVLAALITLGFAPPRSRRVVVLAIALATAYGVVDELHQAHVPRRDPSAGDLVADLLGATAGALLARRRLVYRRRHGDPP